MRAPAITLAVLLAGAGTAHGQATVRISEADCSRLVAHVPAPDVAYRPGVDVEGNAVAPADLGGARARIPAPESITFPLTLDLAERLGIDDANLLARPVIGVVEVTRDGRVTFDGEPLTSDAAHALARKCQEVRRAR